MCWPFSPTALVCVTCLHFNSPLKVRGAKVNVINSMSHLTLKASAVKEGNDNWKGQWASLLLPC